MSLTRSLSCSILAVVLGSSLGRAVPAAEAPKPVRRDRLTLTQTIRLGVGRNLRLLGERLEKRRKRYLADAAYRFVAPTLSLGTRYDSTVPDDRLPPRETGVDYDADVNWTTPLGTTLSVGADYDRAVAGEPRPDHTGSLVFSLTQPLLKDGWASGSGYSIKLAELAKNIQEELFLGELNRLLVDIQRAYWELAFAEADLQIKIRSKERAKQRFEDTQQNIALGILAPAEIFVVEENLVFFSQALLQAKEKVKLAQFKLAEMLVLDPLSELETADRLEWPVGELPEVEAEVALAVEKNPGLKAQRYRWEHADIRRKHERNQRLPRLDLSASYKAKGQDANSGALYAEVREMKRPETSVGLTLSVPLWGNPDRARVMSSIMEAEKSRLELAKQRQAVGFRVRNLLTRLNTGIQRLALAKKRVELSESKLKAEGEKYKEGSSTLADVVRFQRELDLSQIEVQREQLNLIDNHNRLLETRGALPEANGIAVK